MMKYMKMVSYNRTLFFINQYALSQIDIEFKDFYELSLTIKPNTGPGVNYVKS